MLSHELRTPLNAIVGYARLLRGRVLSLYILASLGVIPFGNLLAGAVAETFGAPLALAGGGSATLAILIAVAIAFPVLRGLRPERELAIRG